MTGDQHARKNHDIKIDNYSFQKAKPLQYLGKPLTNQNSIHKEIEEETGVRECFLSFGAESFVFSLLSKNIKIKIYRTVSLFLYGCETWSLNLRVFENRALRRIFGPERDEVNGEC